MVIILLDVAGEVFGLPVAVVQDMLTVTRTGRRADWRARGAGAERACTARSIDVDGRLAPLVDLRASLGITPRVAPSSRVRSVLVVQSGERWLGLLVDAVGEIVEIPRDAIEPAPEASGAHRAICWVARHNGRAILLLDVDTLLPPEGQLTVA